MRLGLRLVSIVLIVSLILVPLPIFQFPQTEADLINPGALLPFNTIYINGNSQFTAANGVVSGTGIATDPYVIENWSINAGSSIGIHIRFTTAYFIIKNCHIYYGNYSNYGLYLYESDNGIIEYNRIEYNYHGIHLYYADHNIIRNNNCSYNKNDGIRLDDCYYNELINNTCNSNSDNGIISYHSYYNLIENNICTFNSDNGIQIYISNYELVKNNSCESNSDYGISILYASTNIFTNNSITKNIDGGIDLYNGLNNQIYNNYFNNQVNYRVSLSNSSYTNYWNISKTSGENIVGGPYLGGNYWSDYTGYDQNQDRLGDSNLPYGPGDYLPLVIYTLPQIIDNTPNTPTTGDPFIFNATVKSNSRIDKVYVQYHFDQKPSQNSSIALSKGDLNNGFYTQDINVPNYAFKLNYSISAKDILGKWSSSGYKELNVIDNDRPIIKELSTLEPITNESYLFNFSVTDNINVTSVDLEFWFDHGVHQNISLSAVAGFYYSNTTVPKNAKKLRYSLSTLDYSSNYAGIKLTIINVTDNIRPNIIDNSGSPTTGENFIFNFEFNDNILVSMAYLEYWFDDDEHYNVSLPLFPEKPIHRISVPSNAFILHSKITTIDSWDNQAQLKITKSITDNDPPIIIDKTPVYPETGETFIINCTIYENRILENYFIEYCFKEGKSKSKPGIFLDGEYYFELEIPSNATILQYSVFATDASNNDANVTIVSDVIDIIPPEIQYLTEHPPTTGDIYTINASVEDNIKVDSCELKYWFYYNYQINEPFENTMNITVPSNARAFNCNFLAIDSSGNEMTVVINLEVIDNDPPIIQDIIPTPTTGDEFEFDFSVIENIKITSGYLEYWFDSDDPVIVNFAQEHSIFSVTTPSNSKELNYTIFIEDSSKNTAKINRNIKIKDNDPPIIIDHSTQSGANFRFKAEVTDNLNISNVKVNYWFEDGIINIENLRVKDGFYEGIISIPDNENKIFYVIIANDTPDNRKITEENEVKVSIEKPTSASSIFENNILLLIIIILIILFIIISVFYTIFKRRTTKSQPESEQEDTQDNIKSTIPDISESKAQLSSAIKSPQINGDLIRTKGGTQLPPVITSSTPKIATPKKTIPQAPIKQQLPETLTQPQLPPARAQISTPIAEKAKSETDEMNSALDLLLTKNEKGNGEVRK